MQIFLVKENLACQLFLDKEILSSLKFARVDGQQGKCENCKGKLVDHLHEQ